MRREASDAIWASAVQWARVGIGGAVFLIAARSLPLAEIGAFAMAAAPLRFLQVIHKGGIEDAAVVTAPEDRVSLAALQRLSLCAGLGSGLVALALAPALDRVAPGAGIGAVVAALAPASLAHGIGAVADGMLRRAGLFRALAMRTFAGQLVAAALALWALVAGLGLWALVLFTLAQAGIAAALSLAMAGWPGGPVQKGALRAAAARVTPLAARVLVGAVVQPLLQVAIGATAGLAAAGVWQVALRVVGLLEAVTVVPLRFVALPRLAAGSAADLRGLVTAASLAGVWVMGGTALAAPALMAALMGAPGAEVVPVLRILCAGAVAGGGIAVLYQALIGAGRGHEALRIALAAAVTAVAAGGAALAIAADDNAARLLALSQVAAGIVPLWLLLRADRAKAARLGVLLRPWAGLLVMLPAVWGAGFAAAGLPPAAIFAAQAVAGTAALAAVLPRLAPETGWRR